MSNVSIQCNLYQITDVFLTEIEKDPKILMRHKRPHTPKAILSKKSNAGSIAISYLKLYYRTTITKNGIVFAQKEICRPIE
jgi:hypothetical protein